MYSHSDGNCNNNITISLKSEQIMKIIINKNAFKLIHFSMI